MIGIVVEFTGGCVIAETLFIFSKLRISNCFCKCHKYDVHCKKKRRIINPFKGIWKCNV
jgi:hypothetical protein